MQQFRVAGPDGRPEHVTEDEMVRRAEAFHIDWRRSVRNQVHKIVRTASRGSLLVIGSPEWNEFIYGPNASLAGAMDHDAYLRSQTHEWHRDFFSARRLQKVYGTPAPGYTNA